MRNIAGRSQMLVGEFFINIIYKTYKSLEISRIFNEGINFIGLLMSFESFRMEDIIFINIMDRVLI